MSGIKTSGGMARMVHMVSSRRLRQSHVEDRRVDVTGCVGPCYPCFVVFFVLGPKGVLVF
jgi:hypothetical protein